MAGTKTISAAVEKGLNKMPVLSRKGLVTLIVLVLGLLMITSLAMLKSKPQREPRAKPASAAGGSHYRCACAPCGHRI